MTEAQRKMMEARGVLFDTDWIFTKMVELRGEELRAKYQDAISKREEARAAINAFEAQAALDDQADFEQAMAEHDPDWQAKRDLINHNK